MYYFDTISILLFITSCGFNPLVCGKDQIKELILGVKLFFYKNEVRETKTRLDESEKGE